MYRYTTVRKAPQDLHSLQHTAMSMRRHEYATELSSLASGVHGRQRRHERNIEKIDLQRARRYGMKEAGKNGRIKFTYGGVVFIYDPIYNREVTSFPSPDVALETSGTKCAQPILLPKRQDYEDEHAVKLHEDTRIRIISDPKQWKSHSVLVVDMSGSMRRDDVNGARCRSDGVWMALARDYVKKQLDERIATPQDLVSVVVMKDTADIPMVLEPMDWVLYNKLVDMREWSELRPSGPGNYMPALETAERLLAINPHSSCALSLMFFSDGKPSDKGPFAEHMGKLASKYRRRLTVCCIGMADENEQFSTLHDMVTEAEAYGSISSFNKPSMHTDSLSNIITSMVSSLTASKTEMTDVTTGKQSKVVRDDVRRERKNTPDDIALTGDWIAYRNSDSQHYVRRVWSWSQTKNDFTYLKDPRCIFCYKTVSLNSSPPSGIECPNCHACNVCTECFQNLQLKKHYKTPECHQWLRDIRTGKLVDKEIPSFSVAMKVPIFDEGAERVVHKFRFLDDKDRFIGPKMVAKQSRFVELEGSYEQRMNYHREFMRTQTLASEFADLFNQEIDSLVNHFDAVHHSWIRSMPRIKFLEPLVVEVVKEDGKELNILVETMLEGENEYKKFNNNSGWVQGRRAPTTNSMDDLTSSFNQLGLNADRGGGGGGGLGAIEEGSEDEDEGSDDEEGIVFDNQVSGPEFGEYKDVHERHFPQAFSHYTYEKSKKRLMVVDLQGKLEEHEDGTRQYVLTDPVIHKRKGHTKRRSKKLETWTFGRTDRGEKGMKAFFETHECSDVCRLLGLTDSRKKSSH